jgi:sialic acid synthase SpsE
MTPTIVAEISCNHAGDKAKAHRLIDAAGEAGADAVKFQLFEPEEMAWPAGNVLGSGPWRGHTLFELYRAAQTPRAWFPALFKRARKLGLTPFASVFSLAGIEFLEDLGCPWYKIASAEVVWPELLEAVAATGKPAIISDGIATKPGIRRALDILGSDTTVVLRCVSGYPAKPEEYGFMDMPPTGHSRTFDAGVRSYGHHEHDSHEWLDSLQWCAGSWGVSDHSLHPIVATVATALGASMIEAHLMLDAEEYDTPPLDAGHSHTPYTFEQMALSVRLTYDIATTKPKRLQISEWQRRLVWVQDRPIGWRVLDADVVCLRGDRGIAPHRRSEIIGKEAEMRDIAPVVYVLLFICLAWFAYGLFLFSVAGR